MTNRKITLSLRAAMEACAAIMPHIKDADFSMDQAMILDGYLYGTDRFTAGRAKFRTDLPEGEIIQLPRDAVSWISRIPMTHLVQDAKIYLDNYMLTIEAPEHRDKPNQPRYRPRSERSAKPSADEATWAEYEAWTRQQILTVSIHSERFGVEMLRKFTPEFRSYPTAIPKLFTDFKPGGEVTAAMFNPHYVERFTTYAKKWAPRFPFRLELSESRQKPGIPGTARIRTVPAGGPDPAEPQH